MKQDNVSIKEFQEILRTQSDKHSVIEALRRLLGVSEPSQWVGEGGAGMGWSAWP